MQITITHNSELLVRKLQAQHYLSLTDYPVTGDNHYPSIGEECEVAKQNARRLSREKQNALALANIFKKTQEHKDLKKFVDMMENQETLFEIEG